MEVVFIMKTKKIMTDMEVDKKVRLIYTQFDRKRKLTDDLISIIHYYSMKSYSNRRKFNNAEKVLKGE